MTARLAHATRSALTQHAVASGFVPAGAVRVECESCHGDGRVPYGMESVTCGGCLGSGWQYAPTRTLTARVAGKTVQYRVRPVREEESK